MDDVRQVVRIILNTPVFVPGVLVGIGVLTQIVPLLALGVSWILLKAITVGMTTSSMPTGTTPKHWAILAILALALVAGLWLVTGACTPDRPCEL